MLLLAVAQGAADHLGGDINDLDHFFVGHAHGADHAQGTHDLTINLVRRGDHRKLLVGNDLAFAAYVDAHALGAAGHIEQAHQLGLLFEQVKQLAQIAHIS